MASVTFIGEDVRTVDVDVSDGWPVIDPTALPDVLGWELKPEGLCRGDVCIPVRDRDRLFAGDRLDVGAVAQALGGQAVFDTDAGLFAMPLPAEQRRMALESLQAPPFSLPDLEGAPRALAEWAGKKKLLVAFASW